MKSAVFVYIGVLLAVMSLVPAVAAADEPASSETTSGESQLLTVAEALERARAQNYQIQLGEAGLEQSQLTFDEARAGRLPSLSVEGQYTNNLAMPVIVLPDDSPFGEGVLRTGNRHNLNASAQVSVPIYSAQLNRGIDLSRAAAELEQALHEATVREVEIEVQRAFVNGLMTREAREVLEQSHETLQRNLELVESLYEQGAVPEYDLIRTDVQVSNLEPELSRAHNSHEGALNYIKLLTGISLEEEIALDTTLQEFYASLPDLEFKTDFDQNVEIIQAAGQAEIADRQVDLERSAYIPTVSAFGSFNYQGQGDALTFWNYEWTDTASVGVSLSIPLFSPGRRQQLEQARAERRRAEIQQEFLRESLQSQFQTTASNIRALEETIIAQERNVGQAERGFKIARVSYEEGVYSLMDVNDAEEALTEARLNYSNALADYINAVLDMEDLVGSTETTKIYE